MARQLSKMNGGQMTKLFAHLTGLFFIVLISGSLPAQADVHKCTMPDGGTSYQDHQCNTSDSEQIIKITDGYFREDYSQTYIDNPDDNARPLPVYRDADGKIARSESSKNAFKASNPCPSNGQHSGPCPGFVIDHIKALACGGADQPSNMQWQTIQAGKNKDKWERDGCPESNARYSQRATYKEYVPGSSGVSGYGGDNSSHESGNSTIYTGPRGGRYTITPSGNKSYINR